jgi:hypothetical protein
VRWSSVVLGSCALLLAAPSVHAAPLTDRQVAQSLFDQARELMAKNEHAKACPMLVESQRLDPGGGTLLNLALCYEGEGKLATAQLALNDALSQAAKDGRGDRETIARERLAALAPRVPKLTLLAPAHPPRGLVLELDGITMSAATSGVALPVDPGPHEVRLSAPGYVTWTSTPRLREGEAQRVQLPDLVRTGSAEAAPPPPPPRAAPLPPRSDVPTTKLATPSWVFAGAGAGALVASLVTGVLALNARSDFEKRCFVARNYCANPSDADLATSARGLAWASTGLLVVAIGAGAAAYFWPRTAINQGVIGRVTPLGFTF